MAEPTSRLLCRCGMILALFRAFCLSLRTSPNVAHSQNEIFVLVIVSNSWPVLPPWFRRRNHRPRPGIRAVGNGGRDALTRTSDNGRLEARTNRDRNRVAATAEGKLRGGILELLECLGAE